ncbi:MAG: SDR family oxidoreductase [Elusimicrobia bacterium]|nr:SDR family oxidoreductase [Elusimicrobiota bacterium]
MPAQRLLVVGGTGLVGNALVRAWARRGAQVTAATYHRRATTDFRQLDMRDPAAVDRLIEEVRPRLVALPAANPFVDYCELHPEETRQVNVAGSLNVLRAANANGARVIFFSSDYVFDGKKGVYTEDDPVNPINEYGRQKAEVEAAMLKGAGNLVVRTSGAYGWQWEPKNFVLQIISKLSRGEAIAVAEGLRYNPTYTENLADIVCELAELGASGLYHAVGADRVRRLDFARQAAEAFGLDAALIKAVPEGQFKTPAPRPRESSLETDKVRAKLKTQPWGTLQGLAHMAASEPQWKLYAEKTPARKS